MEREARRDILGIMIGTPHLKNISLFDARRSRVGGWSLPRRLFHREVSLKQGKEAAASCHASIVGRIGSDKVYPRTYPCLNDDGLIYMELYASI